MQQDDNPKRISPPVWRQACMFQIWVTLLHIVAIGVFTHGFLLTRVELPNTSTCEEFHFSESNTNSSSCRTPAFRNVVLLIVDALRWDFVDPASNGSSPVCSVGKLSTVQALLEQRPSASLLLKFIADPPTTTQQRLKGLLTGGLPTFIDVGNSFGAKSVLEDNLLSQLAAHGRRVQFFGDDTWADLFERSLFSKVVTYPSLNVKDLDTVDEGVRANMLPAMKSTEEWDVLIGHGLGVDHAGHIFRADSKEMARKLAHVDALVRALVQAMENSTAHESTLLLVMGDHGQTVNGDHGGGTPEETETAIFAYTPHARMDRSIIHNFFQDKTHNGWRCPECNGTMPQVDFAPTMAALLGVPIPFGSVGRVSASMWALTQLRSKASSKRDLLAWLASYQQILRSNAWQVRRYLDTYESTGGRLSSSSLDETNRLFAEAEAMPVWSEEPDNPELVLVSKVAAYMEFLSSAANLARAQWTQFSEVEMVFGIVLLASSGAVQAYLLSAHQPWGPQLLDALGGSLRGAAMGTVLGSIISFVKDSRLGVSMAFGGGIGAVAAFMHTHIERGTRSASRLTDGTIHTECPVAEADYIALAMVAVHAFSLVSNSFIEAEGEVVHMILVTMLLVLIRQCVATNSAASFRAVTPGLALLAALRVMSLEELDDRSDWPMCVHLVAGAALTYLPLLLLMALVYRMLKCLLTCSHPNVDTRNVPGLIRKVVLAQYAAVGLHWALGLFSVNESARDSEHWMASLRTDLADTILPRTVYVAALSVMGWVVVRCLVEAVKSRDADRSAKMLGSMSEQLRGDDVQLGVVVASTLAGVLTMLLGPEKGALLMLFGAGGLQLQLAMCTNVSNHEGSKLKCLSTNHNDEKGPKICYWLPVVAWRMHSVYMFFISGHACRFNSLHFNAAMIGFTDFNYYIQGALLALDTWGFDLIHIFTIPLICTAVSLHSLHVGETVLSRSGASSLRARSYLVYGTVRVVPMLVTMVFVALERRHLMVWAIFAPKYAFEGVGLLVGDAALLIAMELSWNG